MPVRMVRTAALSVVFAGLTLSSRPAFAWGPYLHQQIYLAATDLMKTSPLGDWLWKNRQAGKRYSMSPDIDWQNFGPPPSDPELAHLRSEAARHEGATHFYDVDGFTRRLDPLTLDRAVPRASDYRVAAAAMAARTRENRQHLQEIGISPTNPSETERWGSAPWRAQQLFDLSIESLVNGDAPTSMLRLAALSHYVSDLAVPFHTSVNFDGQDRGEEAKGVHLAFEMKMPEALAASFGSRADASTGLWEDFSASEKEISDALRGVDVPLLPREEIVDALVDLAIDSFRVRSRIADAFVTAKQRAAAEGLSEQQMLLEFGDSHLIIDGSPIKVSELAHQRASLAAWFTARLWKTALTEAEKSPSFQAPSAPVRFEPEFVMRNYPAPVYLSPALAKPLPKAVGCREALAMLAR